MKQVLKDLWWMAQNGLFYALHRTAERLTVYGNVYRDVRKLKDIEVSGDHLAPYSRDWRQNWEPYMKEAANG